LLVETDSFIKRGTLKACWDAEFDLVRAEQAGDCCLPKPVVLSQCLGWNTVPVVLDELLDGRCIEPIDGSEPLVGYPGAY
jgi:hypothetical protein